MATARPILRPPLCPFARSSSHLACGDARVCNALWSKGIVHPSWRARSRCRKGKSVDELAKAQPCAFLLGSSAFCAQWRRPASAAVVLINCAHCCMAACPQSSSLPRERATASACNAAPLQTRHREAAAVEQCKTCQYLYAECQYCGTRYLRLAPTTTSWSFVLYSWVEGRATPTGRSKFPFLFFGDMYQHVPPSRSSCVMRCITRIGAEARRMQLVGVVASSKWLR